MLFIFIFMRFVSINIMMINKYIILLLNISRLSIPLISLTS